jgi:hypothetical protein
LSHVLEHLTMTVTQKVYWWSAYEMSLVLGLKYASELTKERSQLFDQAVSELDLSLTRNSCSCLAFIYGEQEIFCCWAE